jgi:hypothetical protein
MAYNDTVKHLRELLSGISVDLEKAAGGNKAASQRVRTGTIRLEKVAKHYRKESISNEKHGGSKRQSAKKAKAQPKAKTASKAKAQTKSKTMSSNKKPMMMKRATAKIPTKKA